MIPSMPRRMLIPFLALALAGCSGKSGGSAALGTETGSIAGVRWTLPRDWSSGGERPMRVATYTIPGSGGAEPGECAVFYFGSGQGGTVDANLQRWIDQFEAGARTQRSTSRVNGMAVSRVEVDGNYLAPSGPMMQSQGTKTEWRLLGAIVEAPEGMVFFKCTGPVRTLNDARAAFDAMVASLRKG